MWAVSDKDQAVPLGRLSSVVFLPRICADMNSPGLRMYATCRSASLPNPLALLRQCENYQAEMEYLKEREGELRGELCRARAENAALSAELKRTHDVYKEALAARRTAREALSEMAQQNARLVSAFVEKKQDLRNLQVCKRCEFPDSSNIVHDWLVTVSELKCPATANFSIMPASSCLIKQFSIGHL